jgi:hypothetical protein
MKSILNFILIISFCILSSGCGAQSDTIPPPAGLGFPDGALNKDLRVSAPANWNDFKKEEDFITLEITLVTNKQIVTRPDFNAEIYLYDDVIKEWKEIENFGNYETPPDEITLHQGDVKGLAVLPDLSQASACQNNVLILVSGNVIENGVKTDQVVGTYIILKLEP